MNKKDKTSKENDKHFESGCGGNNAPSPREIYELNKRGGAKSSRLEEFLKTPEMKKLRKKAMKLQGADKLIRKVKESGEA
jgi:hypothetical protein